MLLAAVPKPRAAGAAAVVVVFRLVLPQEIEKAMPVFPWGEEGGGAVAVSAAGLEV